MDEKILKKNPGPFSVFLLNEKKKEKKNNQLKNFTIMRSDKSKKNNSKNKDMVSKSPNIKLIDGSAENKIKVKNNASINNINLIKDSLIFSGDIL